MQHAEASRAEVGKPIASENLYSLRDGIVAGALAGISMTIIMALWGALTNNGIWYPVNLIASTVLPSLQNASDAQLRQFIPEAVLVGTLLHFLISIALGLVFDLLLPTLPGHPMLWALLIGPLLWLAAQFVILPFLNERIINAIAGPTFFVAHLVYSLVLGYVLMRANHLQPSSKETKT